MYNFLVLATWRLVFFCHHVFDPLYPLLLPQSPFPFGNHHPVIHICEMFFIAFCLSWLFISYFLSYISHVSEIMLFYPFLSDLHISLKHSVLKIYPCRPKQYFILFMTGYYSILYMYHIFFIQSFVKGHWGCFHVLAMVNNEYCSEHRDT